MGKGAGKAFVAVLPLIVLFFAAQKYFVEGIATSGMKGCKAKDQCQKKAENRRKLQGEITECSLHGRICVWK